MLRIEMTVWFQGGGKTVVSVYAHINGQWYYDGSFDQGTSDLNNFVRACLSSMHSKTLI